MSRSDFIRLALFRVLAAVIMVALLAGGFSVYSAALEAEFAAPEPITEPTPTPIPEPVYDFKIPAVEPPASNSDLSGIVIAPTGPLFVSADGSALDYAWGDAVPMSAMADTAWFDDAAFIGNSLCDGLMLFGDIKNAKFYCAKSINVANIYTEPCINTGGGEYISITDALSRDQYGKVFIMLGINEVFRESDWFYDYYADLIDYVREIEPNAEIYIHSILPVTQKKSSSGNYNRANVIRQNEQLVNLCKDKQAYYIDIFSHFSDPEGHLPSEASSDGVHLTREYYLVWSDYLKTHTITEVTE